QHCDRRSPRRAPQTTHRRHWLLESAVDFHTFTSLLAPLTATCYTDGEGPCRLSASWCHGTVAAVGSCFPRASLVMCRLIPLSVSSKISSPSAHASSSAASTMSVWS